MSSEKAVVVENLTFAYDETQPKVLNNMSFSLDPGTRCLLVGANGSGKSTLLRILSGIHAHGSSTVNVLGHSAFYNTPAGIKYLGSQNWRRSYAAAGQHMVGDVYVHKLIENVENEFMPHDRKEKLIDLLGVDLNWRMHKVSDGQRRRVQILLSLLQPSKLLLLDEITIDLDVLVRHDLMEFLKEESETKGTCIVYATHIFDGLNNWPTHILHISEGQVVHLDELLNVMKAPMMENGHNSTLLNSLNSPLLTLVYTWLKEDYKRVQAKLHRDGKTAATPSVVEQLAEKTDKFYNYWG